MLSFATRSDKIDCHSVLPCTEGCIHILLVMGLIGSKWWTVVTLCTCRQEGWTDQWGINYCFMLCMQHNEWISNVFPFFFLIRIWLEYINVFIFLSYITFYGLKLQHIFSLFWSWNGEKSAYYIILCYTAFF